MRDEIDRVNITKGRYKETMKATESERKVGAQRTKFSSNDEGGWGRTKGLPIDRDGKHEGKKNEKLNH